LLLDASPIIHLAKANHLGVLLELYDKIYCAPAVVKEVRFPERAVEFLRDFVIVQPVKDKSIMAAVLAVHPKIGDGELETYALYKELNVASMLFLNTKAQNIFRHGYNANVHDVIHLPDIDISKRAFKSEKEVDEFYAALYKVLPTYALLGERMRQRRLISWVV